MSGSVDMHFLLASTKASVDRARHVLVLVCIILADNGPTSRQTLTSVCHSRAVALLESLAKLFVLENILHVLQMCLAASAYTWLPLDLLCYVFMVCIMVQKMRMHRDQLCQLAPVSCDRCSLTDHLSSRVWHHSPAQVASGHHEFCQHKCYGTHSCAILLHKGLSCSNFTDTCTLLM